MSNKRVHGKNAKTYINTGTRATPTQNLVKHITDETLSIGKESADLMDRDSEWKKNLQGHKTASLAFTYRHKKGTTDTVLEKIKDSFYSGTPYEWYVMDDLITTSGAYGFRAFMEVTKFDQKRPNNAELTWDVELQLVEHEESAVIQEPEEHTVA
jgi:hypothetical protein